MNTDIEMDADGDWRRACPEALLASTLALMTAHAQGCCEPHRRQVARKVAEHLGQLGAHPLLSQQFRGVLGNLQTLWQLQLERGGAPVAPRDERLWHAAPGAVQ